MKTILVVYTNRKLTKKEFQSEKKYAFNTKDDVEIGDLLDARPDYLTRLQVVEIFDKEYKFVNTNNGDLKDSRTNTNDFELREIIIGPEKDNVVYASKVK